jgi:hypothetical protein
MAKKARKATAAKAGKAKTSAGKKRTAAKARRKAATHKRTKSVAKKKSVAKGKRAGSRFAKRRESLLQKVEGAVEAVLDTLTDAEQLHRKLEPEVSREPE